MTYSHGGNIVDLSRRANLPAEQILDFSASINPLGAPPSALAAIKHAMDMIGHYPDPYASQLAEVVAGKMGVDVDQIVVGNGSTELLYAIPRAMKCRRALIPVPSYIDYTRAAELAGMQVESLPLGEENNFAIDWPALCARLAGDEMVFLGRPGNPSGIGFDVDQLAAAAKKHTQTIFVVDEAFIDFASPVASAANFRLANIIVIKSLTKFYAIPGLRLGFAVADSKAAGMLRQQIPPWTVNTLAQAAGVACLRDDEYANRSRQFVAQMRDDLVGRLAGIAALQVFPGQANYLLVKILRGEMTARQLADRLLADGIAIRVCDNFAGLDDKFFRIAVRTASENAKLCTAMQAILCDAPSAKTPAGKKTPAIMFQGTSSNAGKSILTAAICRILLQDGLRVAPFKSQNMSLNSFVTADGGEMGRAQVVQAQACRIAPDVRMNPILLKPTADHSSQVIVRGKPIGNMRVGQYIDYKRQGLTIACECYDSLAEQFDAIVIEGAGSPAEINLKHHDIVNMAMAQYANAPVLLVGDIDRGGVFASFVGTMEMLDAAERNMVAGFVINRFRGDASLLAPAIDFVRTCTGKGTLGIVPFIPDLSLPEEDSVEFKSGLLDDASKSGQCVEIAIVDLPHISNFTDFDALKIEPDVNVRIVRAAGELHRPDAVIIPGTKNVITDLNYLRTTGLADGILALANSGKTVVAGICGGLQMLGKSIGDPHGIESGQSAAPAMGLLKITTELAREKTLTLSAATHPVSGNQVKGYEIHHGLSAGDERPFFVKADGAECGFVSSNGKIWGTYLHGVFDADGFRRWFIDELRAARGMAKVGKVVATYDIESSLDRLAAIVRENIDMKEIYRLMKL